MRYANQIGYTDVTPYEVVRTVSPKCVEIREMGYELDPTWTPDVRIGGFVGHTVNNGSQRWIITSDDSASVIRIRQHKDGQWRDAYGSRYKLADEPMRHYDFNF